ncbi:GIY-YIG nuclease family protein [Caldivirga maquilingensis]|uniref:GIY-YIG nuclease family protein n=1 Tax=Caldivirga maquilingensis TaxID=76887 RepID=UPI000AF06C89|nr:GIY-YIG nuclease family protein [Caldivirga maquilingensis]
MDFNELSVERGTYVLILKVSAPVSVKVASLGWVTLSEGYYAYVGSAKVGVKTRVGRHLRLVRLKTGKLRWHLDYILVNNSVEPYSIIYVNESFIEHEVAQALLECRDTEVAARGFGSSDCNCVSHFFKLKTNQDPSLLVASLIRRMGYTPCVLRLNSM